MTQPPTKHQQVSMQCEPNSTSCVVLLEMRDRLIARFRRDLPVEWRHLIATFLREVSALPEPLPPSILLLVLTDFARELDRLAPVESSVARRRPLLAALGTTSTEALTSEALSRRFEAAVHEWCLRLGPGTLIPEVQARRIAEYIDQHFAEQITLATLSRVSGWRTRHLSRAFRSSMRMSIRQYLQAARIDQAAARLRQGDKVESVIAAVGWRGRKNFFRHFKQCLGTTPAQYRDGWTACSAGVDRRTAPPSPELVPLMGAEFPLSATRLHRSPRSPRSHRAPSDTNYGSV
jgi:AraC-like DNA-binding protein